MIFAEPRTRHLRAGFTLVELLAVIAIIGILAGILIPVIGRVRESARATECSSNLRQVYGISMLYAADNRGFFPNPAAKVDGDANWWEATAPYRGTKVLILGCPTHYLHLPDSIGSVSKLNNYGMNYKLGLSQSPVNTVRRTLASLPAPSRTLMATEGAYNSINTLSIVYRGNILIPATFDGSYNGGVHRGANNVLWCDGHVTRFADVQLLKDDEAGESSKYWTPGFN